MTDPQPDPKRRPTDHLAAEDYSGWSRAELVARLRALEGGHAEAPKANRPPHGPRDHQTRYDPQRQPSDHLGGRAPMGYLALNQEGRIASINATGAHMLASKSRPLELEGEPLSAYLDPTDVQPFYSFLQNLFRTDQAASIELRSPTYLALPPRSLVLEGLPPRENHHGQPVVRLVLTDITETKAAQAQQNRANLALRSLNAVHKAEQETADPQALLYRVCDYLTSSIGFRLAVVMVPSEKDPEELETATSAGPDRLLACAMDPATWDLPPNAAGPLKAAACSRSLVVKARPGDPPEGTQGAQDHTDCLHLGSAAALPLRTEEGLLGVLGLYSGHPGAFDAAEIAWLDEVAAETALAWRNLELRRARAVLEQERSWLTQILDASPDCVAIADAQGKILYRNQGALRLLGYAAGELPLGLSIEAAYAPWATDRLRATVLPAIHEVGVWRGEMALLSREGREVPIFQITIGHHDENGELVRLSMVGHDLSALKQHRMDLERQSHLAALGELASVLAHQVNQPLTAATNFAEGTRNYLEAMEAPPDFLRSGLDHILEQTHKAGGIVQSLRNFLQGGKPQIQPVDLNHLIREVVPAVSYQGPEAPYRFYLDLEPELATAQADPIQLREAILNCLNNAVEAMAEAPPADPEVCITTQTTAEWLAIRVRDRGPGLPEELQKGIDRPLFTTKASGLGLGLSICRSIMEAHGGRFWATDNTDDRGATFHILLPLGTGETPD
ncbi:ATP-binding protein [Thiohalorhabdus sp.]|uniref:ATP-binding protein n=1 Tax=Thiohalorhabdus sp. TaxID=3094134 RepID=UPI002FC35FEC